MPCTQNAKHTYVDRLNCQYLEQNFWAAVLVLTTTSVELDEELQNRCIDLTIDDPTDQDQEILTLRRLDQYDGNKSGSNEAKSEPSRSQVGPKSVPNRVQVGLGIQLKTMKTQ